MGGCFVFIGVVVKVGIVVGVDGLFIEIYLEFVKVKSDGVNMLLFDWLEFLLEKLVVVWRVVS